MMEVTASVLDGQRFLRGLRAPYQWAFGAVCVTEVRAIEFRAAAAGRQGQADRQVPGVSP